MLDINEQVREALIALEVDEIIQYKLLDDGMAFVDRETEEVIGEYDFFNIIDMDLHDFMLKISEIINGYVV